MPHNFWTEIAAMAWMSHGSDDLTFMNEHHDVDAIVRPNIVRARRGSSNPRHGIDLIIGSVRTEDTGFLPRKHSMIDQRKTSSRARCDSSSD